MSDIKDLIYEELKQHRIESRQRHEQLVAELKKTNERVASLEASRSRFKGALFGLGLGGTSLGAYIAKIFGGGTPPN